MAIDDLAVRLHGGRGRLEGMPHVEVQVSCKAPQHVFINCRVSVEAGCSGVQVFQNALDPVASMVAMPLAQQDMLATRGSLCHVTGLPKL